MAEELVQVVDAHDMPLRGVTKTNIQNEGLWHRVARVMIEDGDGNILLQKRAHDIELFPDRWDNSASGHVVEGEPYLTAAERELKEELGLELATLEEIGYYASSNVDRTKALNEWQKVFRGTVPQSSKLKLQASEVMGAQWFPIPIVKQLVQDQPNSVTPGLREITERHY